MDLSPIHDVSDCYFFCHYMDQICNIFLYSDFHRKCYFGSTTISNNGSLVESLTNKTVYFTDEALQPVVEPVFITIGTNVEILR